MSLDFRFAHSIAVQRMRRGDLDGLEVPDGEILQVSMIEALLDGCYDGDVTIAELEGRGDFGLGTLAGLDGELVVVDGEFWNIDPDGVCVRAPGDARVPFAALVNFSGAEQFAVEGPVDRAALEATLLRSIDDPGASYALRVEGSFGPVHFRTVVHQDPPYRPLAEVIASAERQFHAERLDGVMVGFYFPDFAAEINQPGFHFHMVSADRSTGGHVYDFTLLGGEVTVGHSQQVHVELPERGLAEVLVMDPALRHVHIHLVRSGATPASALAASLGLEVDEVADMLRRLANRGMADRVGGDDADPSYRPHLARLRPSHLPPGLDDL